MQKVTKALFWLWHHFQAGELPRWDFARRLGGYQARVRRALEWGAQFAGAATAGTCRAVLLCFEALWTFTRVAGVSPTNNAAEQAIRPAVLWRKGSFGNDGTRGATFTERILTTVATLRGNDRPLLPFLTEAVHAFLLGTKAPALLASTN